MGGGTENYNFPLLYVMKMSVRRWKGILKSPKTPLSNIQMLPHTIYLCFFKFLLTERNFHSLIMGLIFQEVLNFFKINPLDKYHRNCVVLGSSDLK